MKSKRRKKQDKKRLKFEKKYFKQKLRGEFEKGPHDEYKTLLKYLLRDKYIKLVKDPYSTVEEGEQYDMVVAEPFIYNGYPFKKNEYIWEVDDNFIADGIYRGD